MNTAADLTELNNAKQKVDESESRFRNLIEEATVAMAVFQGRDMVLTLVNEAMLALWQRNLRHKYAAPLSQTGIDAPETGGIIN